MPRPCYCDRFEKGQPFEPARDCAQCHAWHTSKEYRAHHGGIPAHPLPCIHLGEATGATAECPTCAGTVRIKLRSCAVHGACTEQTRVEGHACCQGCPDRQIYPPVTRRHLLYHVYPRSGNGVWQRNVRHLLKRIGLFNGQRRVAIVTGPGLDAPSLVQRAFGEEVDHWVILPNNSALREVQTFLPLFEGVIGHAPEEAVFYGHTKGVTRPVDPGTTVHRWAQMLYETNLDYWPLVERVLCQHPMAGSFKKVGAGFDGSASAWHYSGAFFWARCDALAVRDWRHIDRQWWGIEAWPGLHFRPEEAGVLFHDGVVPTLDLYAMPYLEGVAVPAYESWRKNHVRDRRDTAGAGRRQVSAP